MKKINKMLITCLVLVFMLMNTSCSTKQSKESEVLEDAPNYANEYVINDRGEKGQYDEAGNFYLADASGYYLPDGTFVKNGSGQVSSPETKDMFNEQLIGNYGVGYNGTDYTNVVVEANQVTIKYGSDTYSIPGTAFGLIGGEGKQAEYSFGGMENGAAGSLNFYETSGIPLSVEVDYSDNSGADFRFTVAESKVLDGIPLDGYVSLDTQGEFGTIPMTDDVKELLLNGVSADYIIVYWPFTTVSINSEDISEQLSINGEYTISEFDENGLECSGFYSITVDSFQNESDAKRYYDYAKSEAGDNDEVEQDSTAVIIRDFYPDMYICSKADVAAQCGMVVYGEHCFIGASAADSNRIVYFSKPYTIEEGIRLNETGKLR